MNQKISVSWGVLLSLALPAAVVFPQQTFAQSDDADEMIEEIVTTGTRRADRSASDSPVPIDVIGGIFELLPQPKRKRVLSHGAYSRLTRGLKNEPFRDSTNSLSPFQIPSQLNAEGVYMSYRNPSVRVYGRLNRKPLMSSSA